VVASGSGCWRMRSTEIYSTATERLVLLNAHNNKCGRDLSRDSRVVIRDRHRIEGALGCVFLLAETGTECKR
jgi:hypothetical protein